MFHYLKAEVKQYGSKILLVSESFGVEVNYIGNKSEGDFFLYPYIDDNKKTVFYYAFDSMEQKTVFENTLKLNGIGPKTAFQIAKIPQNTLKTAIKDLDTKFFQSIPGIGPKSAKKILLELKGNFEINDIETINIDQKLYKNIVKSLKGFGYDTDKIKDTLQQYDGKITSENLSDVVKRLIGRM